MSKIKSMLSPMNDLIFKKIFGSSMNKDIIVSFLSSILDIPNEEYESLTLLDTNTRIRRKKGKYGILDLKIKTKSGMLINIEMQVYPMEGMAQKILFYVSSMVIEQLGKKQNYTEIKKVISIAILNYNMYPDRKGYLRKHLIYDVTNNKPCNEYVESYIIELLKLPKKSDGTLLYYWLKFLISTKKEEFEMLKEKDPNIKSAVLLLEELSEDDEIRRLAEIEDMARRDEYDRIRTASRKGEEKGFRKGRKEGIEIGEAKGIIVGRQEGEAVGILKGKLDTAASLLKIGMTVEQVAELSKLTVDQIRELI